MEYPSANEIIERFFTAVKDHFSGVLKTHGFHLVNTERMSDGAAIRYQSPHVSLEIWYDHLRGGEITIVFKLLDSPVIEAKPFPSYMAASSPALEHCLQRLATTVEDEGQLFLIGDQRTYQNWQQESKLCQQLMWHDMEISGLRAKADAAWQQKDYARVVEVYESMLDDLSPVEQKRLEYARKH